MNTKNETPLSAVRQAASVITDAAILYSGGTLVDFEAVASDALVASGAQLVPRFPRVAADKLSELLARGYRITGYSFERQSADSTTPERGFITHGGLVGRWRNTHHDMGPRVALAEPVTDDEIDAAFGACELLRDALSAQEMRQVLEGFAAGRRAGKDKP